MILKEYPGIVKNGETVIDNSSYKNLNDDFVDQMSRRGKTCLSYYIDKEQLDSMKKDSLRVSINEDNMSGICWSKDFNSQDLANLIINYLNSCSDRNDKLIFATQLHNIILTEFLTEEDDRYTST